MSMNSSLRKNKYSTIFSILLLSLCPALAWAEEAPTVADAPAHVKSFVWEPNKENLVTGQQLTFTEVLPIKGGADPKNFLYSILVYSTDNPVWKTAVPYQRWPLPKIYFNKPGVYSLQVNIVKKGAPKERQVPQAIWLAQFSVDESSYYLN
jgi:hypothetical protein